MEKIQFCLSPSPLPLSGEKNSVLLSEPIDKKIFLRGFMSNPFFSVHPAIFVLIENFVVVVILLFGGLLGDTPCLSGF